jgi:2-C-methyl-D-erythritol 4-phosphate cytidylyltransferase/2-C-methyl-D-erythritol 2,4-cyclodiphosphate synthase
LSNTTLVILCAGQSNRFDLKVKKQWLRCGDIPLWLFVAQRFELFGFFKNIIITAYDDEIKYMQNFSDDYLFVKGGNSRMDSVKIALKNVSTKYVMVTDVARCCIPKSVVKNLFSNKKKANCIVPFIKCSDTVVFQNDIINRDEIKMIQTPQLSNTKLLKKALKKSVDFTDDSGAIKSIGGTVLYVKGDTKSKKLTFKNDLKDIKCLPKPSKDFFVGTGLDIHPFIKNKQMVLGGINIKFPYGFKAHSDGDVLIHSLIDAILGASSSGDIGEFFPDSDDKYKNISSKILLQHIVNFVTKVGFEIVNVDITIIAQQPRIGKYKDDIKFLLSKLLKIPKFKINIKATTAEKLGFIGREEGVAVLSNATLKFYNFKEVM